MNARTTALRVLEWAAEPRGPVPDGPLWELGELARPDTVVLRAVGELARRTAASLGAGVPPFGDTGPVGVGSALLAAAVGGRRQSGHCLRLAEVLAPPRPRGDRPAHWYDLVARHGLVAAVLAAWARPVPGEPEALPETLLRMSPLTAILHRPPQRRRTAEVAAAAALIERPHGHHVLAAGLAPWSSEHTVLRWRAELLTRLDRPELTLDTYTLARLRHGADWDRRLRWARRQLGMPGSPDPLAIETVRFWAPLHILLQRGIALADERPLLTGHRGALRLIRQFRLTTAGAA